MRLTVLAGLFASVLSSPLLAAPVAYVHDAQGDVRGVLQGRSRLLQIGSTLDAGEQVVTSQGGAVVKFEDGQIVAIRENSVFEITNYKYNVNKVTESNVFLSLLKGGFRFVTGAIGDTRRDAIRFRVGTATAGVRGTDVIFFLDSNGDVIATVQEGAVDLTSDEITTPLDQGQGCVAKPGIASCVAGPTGGLPQGAVGQVSGLSLKALPGNNPIDVNASADLVKAVADAADKARRADEAAKKAAETKSEKDIADAAIARAAADNAAKEAKALAASEALAAQKARNDALSGGASPNAGNKPPSQGQGPGLSPRPGPGPGPGPGGPPGPGPGHLPGGSGGGGCVAVSCH